MGLKIAISGDVNTGKSYSRRNMNGDECFVIAPSQKMMHLKDKEGKPIKRLNISSDKYKNIEEILIGNKLTSKGVLIKSLAANPKSDWKISGNFDVIKSLGDLEAYIQFVDKCMPHIKYLFIPDFTHFVSNIIADKVFINRKSGGDAFQKFWELASDILDTFFQDLDKTRDDLITIIEFHTQLDQDTGMYRIFVPAGEMLNSKFKPGSYFDIDLSTYVKSEEEEADIKKRYTFVTTRWDKYNARSANLFQEVFLPNDLKPILQKVREYNGI